MSVLIKLEIKYAIYQWSTEDLLILKKKVYIFGLSGLLNIVKAIFFFNFQRTILICCMKLCLQHFQVTKHKGS